MVTIGLRADDRCRFAEYFKDSATSSCYSFRVFLLLGVVIVGATAIQTLHPSAVAVFTRRKTSTTAPGACSELGFIHTCGLSALLVAPHATKDNLRGANEKFAPRTPGHHIFRAQSGDRPRRPNRFSRTMGHVQPLSGGATTVACPHASPEDSRAVPHQTACCSSRTWACTQFLSARKERPVVQQHLNRGSPMFVCSSTLHALHTGELVHHASPAI